MGALQFLNSLFLLYSGMAWIFCPLEYTKSPPKWSSIHEVLDLAGFGAWGLSKQRGTFIFFPARFWCSWTVCLVACHCGWSFSLFLFLFFACLYFCLIFSLLGYLKTGKGVCFSWVEQFCFYFILNVCFSYWVICCLWMLAAHDVLLYL